MLSYVIKRIHRVPIMTIALLLFAAVVSVVLCGLHKANIDEQIHYEETWRSVPVTLTVTNVAGTQTDDLKAPAFVLDVFLEDSDLYPNFSKYIKDAKWKLHHNIQNLGISGFQRDRVLVGINVLSAENDLLEDDVQITWLSGYDNSIFLSDKQVCLLHYSMFQQLEDVKAPFKLQFQYRVEGFAKIIETDIELYVAGYYTGSGRDNIYCPYQILEKVYYELEEPRVIDSVSGTLTDNELLEELKRDRHYWFAQSGAMGADTFWGENGYSTYPNALDIDDSMLVEAKKLLENSLMVNQICAVAVLVLSAVAGFFVGMLVIRSRKREMAVLRTMGTPDTSIFIAFALESLGSIILGSLLGGIIYMWQPLEQLLLFVLIYAVSMIVSLLIFMNKNLLKMIKEDE